MRPGCGRAGCPSIGRDNRATRPHRNNDHYAELAASATVSQLRTALDLAPNPTPNRNQARAR